MRRLDCLDGLRGLLALYVLLGHMAPFAVLPSWLQFALAHGGGAVDVFFVLSGLVIMSSLDRWRGQARPFLIARAARILPVFLPVFALAVLIQPRSCGFEWMPWLAWNNPAHTICVSGWPAFAATEIAAHLTMTHGLFPQGVLPDVWISFLGAAWSLSAEWQFYALALLVRVRSRLIMTLLAMAAAAAMWRLNAPDAWQFSRAFLPNQAHFFALGVASVSVVQQGKPAMRSFALVLGATLLICAMQGVAGKLIIPLLWAACLAAQMSGNRGFDGGLLGPFRDALQSRACVWLGAISYSLYLVNEPIQKLCALPLARLAGGDGGIFTALWLPASIGLPLIAAVALHRWLERPAIGLGRTLAAAQTSMSRSGGRRQGSTGPLREANQ